MNRDVTISVLAKDTPGLLARLSCVFSRRGKNIISFSAVRDLDKIGFSRITIVCDPENIDQIIKQLNKLVDVLDARLDNYG
ncbi:acetolactate synthase small subunit [Tropheryma whipplei]|nr:acetolactate synthase small subunit [Tropheryma whipplei]MCO8183035.1 acetolactate synthase small subunit [Tropheryma whipplei]MCO8190619.1 acetolactate synthase small subunit [Tropheryma whipplei]CAD67232.1 acetohydroxy acid synthase, small subunit [Tropheryma whipplei TW08/27]